MSTAIERLTVDLLARLPSEQVLQTPIPDLELYRMDSPGEQISYLQTPSLCLILQGAKSIRLNGHPYTYGEGQFACYSVDLPVIAQVLTGSAERPNLGIKLGLNADILLQLLRDLDSNAPEQGDDGVLSIGDIGATLGDAFERLMRLLDTPADIPILAPLIQREIYYRLLVSEQGTRLRQIVRTSSHLRQIMRAIDWLKENYRQPLRVEDLAALCGMSASSFYHHFRHLTATSPLQYQKHLRLTEARRLIKTRSCNATLASIANHVGYESASQFSREYSRYFGRPPSRE